MYTIMIVDDDPTSLAIGRALLENDYRLLLKRSGLQALGSLKEGERPDLMLLDMVMPGVDGMEVLKSLKADPDLRNIPVIFLTGESHVEEEVKSYLSGAADFIQKPVNAEMLRIKISQQLRFLELQRENIRLREALRAVKNQVDPWFPQGA